MALSAAIGMLFALMFFVSHWSAAILNSVESRHLERRAVFMQEEAAKIEAWYRQNIPAIDSQPDRVPPPGVSGWSGLTVLSSKRIDCDGQTQAHRYVLVIPSLEGIGTTLDEDTGQVIAGSKDEVLIADGCRIGKDFVERSRLTAGQLALGLENYFKSRALMDSNPAKKNFFTNAACGGWGGMPCETASPVTSIAGRLGLGAQDTKDAYGGTFILDNSSAAVYRDMPPYSARIGFITPWGSTIWTIATGQI